MVTIFSFVSICWKHPLNFKHSQSKLKATTKIDNWYSFSYSMENFESLPHPNRPSQLQLFLWHNFYLFFSTLIFKKKFSSSLFVIPITEGAVYTHFITMFATPKSILISLNRHVCPSLRLGDFEFVNFCTQVGIANGPNWPDHTQTTQFNRKLNTQPSFSKPKFVGCCSLVTYYKREKIEIFHIYFTRNSTIYVQMIKTGFFHFHIR